MEMTQKSTRAFWCAALSAVLSTLLCFALVATPLQSLLQQVFGKVNLPGLAVSVVAFLLLFFILYRASSHITLPTPSPRECFVLTFGVVLLHAIFLLVSLSEQPGVFASVTNLNFFFRYPRRMRIVVVLWLVLISLWGLIRCRAQLMEASAFASKRLFWCVALLVSFLAAFAAYMPNVLNDAGGLYHFHAYFNSIQALWHGAPFSAEMTSIYGHYAFFFLPILKLFSLFGICNEVRVVMLVLAMLQGLTVLLYAYVLQELVQNGFVRYLGLFAGCLTMLGMEINLYVQGFPHRTFPYAVLAALIVLWLKHRNLAVTVAGYVVCLLILVWSSECGIICLLAWTALLCCAAIQHSGLKAWGKVLLYFGAAALAAVGAYVATNALNVAVGGSWLSVQELLFPLMTDSYMAGFLEEPLYAGPAAWISIVLILLFIMGYGLSNTSLFSKQPQNKPRQAVWFALSVLGLGTLTYAFNRPAYGNFYVMMPLMAVLLAAMVDAVLPLVNKLFDAIAQKQKISEWTLSLTAGVKAGVGCVLLVLLMLLSLFCVANYGSRQDYHLKYRDEYSLEWMKSFLTETFDEGEVVAVGKGAVESFASLGWSTGFPVMDYSDITIDPACLVYADTLLGELGDKAVLIEKDAFELHQEANLPGFQAFLETHVLTETVQTPSECDGLTFYCYFPVNSDRVGVQG